MLRFKLKISANIAGPKLISIKDSCANITGLRCKVCC